MLKPLRTIVSALCLMACVPLFVLWVCSFWYQVSFSRPSHKSGTVYIHSMQGEMVYVWDSATKSTHWSFKAHRVQKWDEPTLAQRDWRWALSPDSTLVFFPHWVPILITASLAVVPWIKWSRRFRLRTLLIAVTLIAVLLGLIAIS